MRAAQRDPAHRALNGWLLALPSTGLAITAHGLAGGAVGDIALLVPITAVIAWAAAGLAAHLRRLVVLVPMLGLVQLGLHLLLSQSADVHPGHGSGRPLLGGWAMFAGHALATVIIAGLLARASGSLAVVSSAIDRLRVRLRALRLTPGAAPAAIGLPSAVPARPGPLLEVLLRRVSSRRGPPVRS